MDIRTITKSQIMLAAHQEAKAIVAEKRISYREAMMYGLRKVYNKLLQERNMAVIMAQPATPQFMWLRGM